MFKKINSTVLLIVLVVLGGLVALNKFYLSKKSESTFASEFVRIDSTKVLEILIYPKVENGKEIKLTRQGAGWQLQSGTLKAGADVSSVKNLLNSFALLPVASVAGTDKPSWKELQVDDSTGSRIKIVTPDKTYDMVLGKFGYNQAARNGITYLRHKDEETVYAVYGFLAFAVNQPANSWRMKTFISGRKEDWTSLTFTYTADSSFVLEKQNNIWLVNGVATDSIKTRQYFTELENLEGVNFADNYSPASAPLYSLTIKGNNQSAPVVVNAYAADSVQKFILHSSLNPDAYFSDIPNRLAERVFVGKSAFINR